MGFLDELMKQALGGQGDASGLGGLAATLSANPQILNALAGFETKVVHVDAAPRTLEDHGFF